MERLYDVHKRLMRWRAALWTAFFGGSFTLALMLLLGVNFKPATTVVTQVNVPTVLSDGNAAVLGEAIIVHTRCDTDGGLFGLIGIEAIALGRPETQYLVDPTAPSTPLTRMERWSQAKTEPRSYIKTTGTPQSSKTHRTRWITAALQDHALADALTTAQRPVVYYVNWIRLCLVIAVSISVVSAILLALAYAHIVLRSFRRLSITRGTCPRCRYPLSGLETPHCPECGEALSMYEQIQLANQRKQV